MLPSSPTLFGRGYRWARVAGWRLLIDGMHALLATIGPIESSVSDDDLCLAPKDMSMPREGARGNRGQRHSNPVSRSMVMVAAEVHISGDHPHTDDPAGPSSGVEDALPVVERKRIYFPDPLHSAR
ncbi:uncharacterized protein N7459_009677 [Penicillium hispanicum]|uniref:uncharacterized protein n=1 Tax=Penicillium hispanicum TaxID=1080232 RepID=UPI0025403CB9|nr:uncharacterized protein N7459_009677 [Penicillium hispanicum]KAJ5570247.1 hypothetical protein N7459_009677 [Penicillium hispanicum]